MWLRLLFSSVISHYYERALQLHLLSYNAKRLSIGMEEETNVNITSRKLTKLSLETISSQVTKLNGKYLIIILSLFAWFVWFVCINTQQHLTTY